jgi:hypothetical protein
VTNRPVKRVTEPDKEVRPLKYLRYEGKRKAQIKRSKSKLRKPMSNRAATDSYAGDAQSQFVPGHRPFLLLFVLLPPQFLQPHNGITHYIRQATAVSLPFEFTIIH